MPGPRQAPASPHEEPPLLEQYQAWYGGGAECKQQRQQKPKDGFIGATGHRTSLLTPRPPTGDVIAQAERLPRRSQQKSPLFTPTASSISSEAERAAVYSSGGKSQHVPLASEAHYGSQHTSTSDMHVPSDKGCHPHHYKPPPARPYAHSAPARASGGPHQQPFASPSPSLSMPLRTSAAISSIRHLNKQSPFTAAVPPMDAGLPAGAGTATTGGSLYHSASSLNNQPGQLAGGRCSTSGVYQSTTCSAASQQNSTTKGRSMLHQQQHSSSSLSSSSSSPSTSSTLPSSLTANSQLSARQPPPTKMQYQYYNQPLPPLPPQNGLNVYHQTAHSQPPPPFAQLYSMARLGQMSGINNKLNLGAGSNGPGRPLTAEEKEMKRKVSHSAIEKRRRERTNAVLRELQTIVPGLSKPGKIQKLEILEAAADYIRQLTTAAASESMSISAARAKQRRNSRHHHRMLYQQEIQGLGDYNTASRRGQLPESAVERPKLLSPKAIDDQHLASATPMSVSSTASNNDDADDADDDDDDSVDDDGAALAERADACRSSEIPPTDPASMKVTFLLC